MPPCSSPPALCRAATGAGDTAAEWPWCGDSSLNARGDLCGQRPAKELLSLLTALEWGGLAVLRIPVSWSRDEEVSQSCSLHPLMLSPHLLALPVTRCPGITSLVPVSFHWKINCFLVSWLPAPACACQLLPVLWAGDSASGTDRQCSRGSSTAKDIEVLTGGWEQAGQSLWDSQQPSFKHFAVGFPRVSLSAHCIP